MLVGTGRRGNSLFQTITAYGCRQGEQHRARRVVGFRRTHFLPRRENSLRRAWIGSCFSQRSKIFGQRGAEA